MQALERDLQAERASALARINDLFQKALDAWLALEAGELELERRVEVRDLAAERLWMLLVQRESVGLRDHRELLQRIPPEIRTRIGPRRRAADAGPKP